MTIYCISGLGADERAFQYLNVAPHQLVHIPWLQPQKNETLDHYAVRMSENINDSEPFSLMGLSFGGMLSVEISKLKKPEKLFLLSTIIGKKEKPLRMKIAGKLGLYKYVPSKYFTQPNKMAHRLFGTKTQSEKELLDQIIRENDPHFIRWALEAISIWENTEYPKNAIRIHGTDDKIFPPKNLDIQYLIEGGGHLMVVSDAKEVSEIIKYSLPFSPKI